MKSLKLTNKGNYRWASYSTDCSDLFDNPQIIHTWVADGYTFPVNIHSDIKREDR